MCSRHSLDGWGDQGWMFCIVGVTVGILIALVKSKVKGADRFSFHLLRGEAIVSIISNRKVNKLLTEEKFK